MNKVIRALCAGAMALTATAAQAQSNALGGAGAPGPAGATRDLGAAIANGYEPFSLAEIEDYLTKASFRVTAREVADDKDMAALIVAAPNGMPFVFLFADCGVQGCMFMEAVQPFAPGRIGMPLSLEDINEYNRNSPLHIFMTAEADGEIGLRWVLPALAGCEATCVNSSINLYFGGVLNIYGAITKASKQMLVEAPFDEPGERVDFAAIARQPAPTMQADAAWGAASAAFGDEALTAATVSLREAKERLRRLRERTEPGRTDFPALLGR